MDRLEFFLSGAICFLAVKRHSNYRFDLKFRTLKMSHDEAPLLETLRVKIMLGFDIRSSVGTLISRLRY